MAILSRRLLKVFGNQANLSSAPANVSFALLCFRTHSADRFIDIQGNITISHTHLTRQRGCLLIIICPIHWWLHLCPKSDVSFVYIHSNTIQNCMGSCATEPSRIVGV